MLLCSIIDSRVGLDADSREGNVFPIEHLITSQFGECGIHLVGKTLVSVLVDAQFVCEDKLKGNHIRYWIVIQKFREMYLDYSSDANYSGFSLGYLIDNLL